MLVYRSEEKSWYQAIEWMWWFKVLFFLVFAVLPPGAILVSWRSSEVEPSRANDDPSTREPRAERDSGSSSSFDWFDSGSSSSSSSSDSGSFTGGAVAVLALAGLRQLVAQADNH